MQIDDSLFNSGLIDEVLEKLKTLLCCFVL